jgi:hypothetical protein
VPAGLISLAVTLVANEEIDAVTEPICEVDAPKVTEPETGKLDPPCEFMASTLSLFEPGTISNPRQVPSDPNPYAQTTVDAGKLEMLAVTLPICAVPAPMVTVPATVTLPMLFVPVGIGDVT